MRFTISTFVAFAAAVSAVAIPEEKSPALKERSDQAGLELCTDVGFGPPCKHAVEPFNQCINLSTLNDKVSSVGPDPGSRCFLFNDFNCQGPELIGLLYPGFSDLTSVYNGIFNDAISSYYCEPS